MARRTLALLVLGSAIAMAQFRVQARSTSARAGEMHLLQGVANIDGKPVLMSRGPGPQTLMNNGQRLHVEWGRLELQLGPGATLSMNQGSTLRMEENRLSDVRVVLEEGSALIKVDLIYKGGRLRVMVPGGAAELHMGGWYRFDANPQRMRVYRGGAELVRDDSTVRLKKGQAVDLSSAAAVVAFNVKDSDPLMAWQLQRTQEAEARQRRIRESVAMQRAKWAARMDGQ